MAPINEIDQRVLATLTGGEKIKALLSERRMTLKDFARKYGEWVEDVSLCIRRIRVLPEIRDMLAVELEMDRSEIDQLIDGEKPAAQRVG